MTSRFKKRAAVGALVGAATLGAGLAQAVGVQGQGSWETTLKARDAAGNPLTLNDANARFFYDATLNVTWLANMNQNGTMTWDGAMGWASSLTDFGGGWRLPKVIDSGTPGCNFSNAGGTDCGYNVQTQVGGAYSEWAHLYYVTLGNKAFCPPGDDTCAGGPQLGWGLTNTAQFQAMQLGAYWTGTEYRPGSFDAWYFAANGLQDYSLKFNESYAVAVRPGDVAAIPEPQTYAMLLLGLGGVLVAARRRVA